MASCLIHGLFHEFCKVFKILLSIFDFTLKFSATVVAWRNATFFRMAFLLLFWGFFGFAGVPNFEIFFLDQVPIFSAMWEHVFILLTDDFLVDYLRSVIPRKEKRAFIFVYFQWIWFLVVGCDWRCQSPKFLRFTKGSYLRPRPSLANGSNLHPNLYEVLYQHPHWKLAVARAWKTLSSNIPFQSSSFSEDMLVMLIDQGVCMLCFFAWSDRSVEVWSVFVKLGWTKTVDASEIWTTIWDYM